LKEQLRGFLIADLNTLHHTDVTEIGRELPGSESNQPSSNTSQSLFLLRQILP